MSGRAAGGGLVNAGPATLDDESFLNVTLLAPMSALRCPTESKDAARRRLFDNMAWVVRIIVIIVVNYFNDVFSCERYKLHNGEGHRRVE
jgi:hypothetical protein